MTHDDPPAESRPGDEEQAGTGVAVLLAVAAVLAATIAGRGSILSDKGSDTFHEAIREHVKQSAAVVEDIRFLYDEEASQALLVAEARILADEYRREAGQVSGAARDFLRLEAAAQEELATTLAEASELAGDDRYETDGDAFDVVGRLADRRALNPELVALDPDATEAEGVAASRKAAALVGTTVPVAVAFLFGALAPGLPRRRRHLVWIGFVFVGIGVAAALLVELML